MGRHRSDPMGIARLLLVGVAIIAVLALIVVGIVALVGSLTSDGEPRKPEGAAQATAALPGPASPLASSPRLASSSPSAESVSAGGDVPTLLVECRADLCPVFVRAPGGDVVEDRDLTRGQQAVYSEPALEVVLGDASTVYVEVNGRPRSPGKPGERQSFTAKRARPE